MVEREVVFIADGGARGQAIAEAHLRSDKVSKVVMAPGNSFGAHLAQTKYGKEVVSDGDCFLDNPQSLLSAAMRNGVTFAEIAQDDALALGTADLLRENGIETFGVSRIAASLEANKALSREFMKRERIPHPNFRVFNDQAMGEHYVQSLNEDSFPIYVKAAGLAAGKGALRAETRREALEKIQQMGTFGDAGKTFVVEDLIVNSDGSPGREFSAFAICDGNTSRYLGVAGDHKRALDGDQGDQTGGMGVVTQIINTSGLEDMIKEELIAKVINGARKEGSPFSGVLYVGGMLVDTGPQIVEYNVRHGDPEVTTILPGMTTDYHAIVKAASEGNLSSMGEVGNDGLVRVCVVGASKGYPNDYSAVKGKEIHGLDDVSRIDGVDLFSAGVRREEGRNYAAGGRLFSIVAKGERIEDARDLAMEAMSRVSIEGDGLHFRTDIGMDVPRYHL